ncbi:MAG: cytochrome c, class [Gemmatimonadetes bacterium]|nr:cytochrome c, class [Gemmatimonadota bacterium]
MRIAASLSAVTLPVLAFAVGASGAAGAPASMRPLGQRSAVGAISAASNRESLLRRRHAGADSTGEQLFRATCMGCHGVDGAGAPRNIVGFTAPLPDFSDCAATTAEMRVDWMAVIRDGGPVRGFNRIMPAFRDLLTPQQIRSVAAYLRTLCQDRRWPLGEFNVALAQTTEKAFPEDEIVVTSAASRSPGLVENHIIFEKRFGIRDQLEVDLPFGFVDRPGGSSWAGGLGDLSIAGKHVLIANSTSGTIVSALAGVVLPTGDQATGLGTGTTAFEGFILGAQLLPARSFFQFQGGVTLPTDLSRAPRSAYWAGALGTTVAVGPITRIWSPIVELTGTRDLVSGAPVDWNTVPQFQVTLSALQHVRLGVGLDIPLTHRDTRSSQLRAYFLWDMADGPFLQGWKGWCPGCEP